MWDGWGHWWAGGLMMILFLVALAAIVWLTVRAGTGASRPPDRPDPLEILTERFARGEISEKEYEERRRVLKGEGS